MGALSKISHIVVLMLENRSFDSLLGQLYPASPPNPPPPVFAGLTGAESNPNPSGPPVPVWKNAGTDRPTMTTPDPDPGEHWTDVNQQICGSQAYSPPSPANAMSGFVANYLFQKTKHPGRTYDPRAAMHFFTAAQVPAISGLARAFAASDSWFASAPCQTWPNRFFAHCATANGFENNEPFHFPYEMETIFNRLESAGRDWRVYFADFPQALTLSKLWLLLDHFHFYDRFKLDAAAGTLPAYSFIEPRYFPDLDLPDDEHPPHDVRLGEQLIADVYNSLRGNEAAWKETLLVVIYDEHGGCYDHVLPPAAPPPGATPTSPFNFDRFGVRVPAILASPYIPAGGVVRASGPQPFDHTSIIRTLRDRFDLGGPLTLRDANAPSLDQILTLDSPGNMGPPHIDALPYTPTLPEIASAQLDDLNDLQRSLMVAAAHLPKDAAAEAVAAHIANLKAGLVPSIADIEAHVSRLGAALGEPAAGPGLLRENARHFVKQRLNQLFGSMPTA
ncbi:MAG TPA: alkaline phosphatase family protein [Xanthobacteraceae bacterium]|nr:alkaline phosphatase family protein [Xanthobacteraceae bacterium]